MTQINILSDDFASPNGFAFLYPIVVYRHFLRDAGLSVRIFSQAADGLADCDVLIIDSKALRDCWGSIETTNRALDRINGWAGKTSVLFFDTADSTGWVNADVLTRVRGYYKNQVLRDRSLYTKTLYGGRLHTDFCHTQLGEIDDQSETTWPAVASEDVAKIRVGWNSGMADYSYAGLYRSRLFRRLRWPALLRPPKKYAPPSAERPLALSCRVATAYSRATVAWQRRQIQHLLLDRCATDRLSRWRYFRELERSRIVVSPFGFGEINYRDYETFISGALLLKPDMSHMETWPEFFRPGETMLTHRWDCSDLVERIDVALATYDHQVEIARQGQESYRHFVSCRAGHEAFASRFRDIVNDAL